MSYPAARHTGRGRGASPRRRVAGFTLIELLVAVFLLSVLSAFAYGTLSYVQKAREATQTSFARERELEVAVHTLMTDFEQLAPRPVRQPLGTDYLPAISADPRTPDLVSFTRGGWSNSAGLPRSTMQRVSYRFDKDRAVLVRSYTNVLDAPLSAKPITRDLLTRVTNVTLRYLPGSGTATPTAAGQKGATTAPTSPSSAPVPLSGNALGNGWLTQWPPPGTSPSTGAAPGVGAPSGGTAPDATGAAATPAPILPRLRPRAVEITLELEDYGKIVRLAEVPG